MNKGISKRRMEELVVENFLMHYNKEFINDYRVIKHQDKPDFIIFSNYTKKYIGLEVALAIFEDKKSLPARKAFNRLDTILNCEKLNQLSEDEIIDNYLGNAHSSDEFDLILQKLILRKDGKVENYTCEYPIYLIIGIGDKMFGISSFKKYVLDDFECPSVENIDQIWISIHMHYDDREKGIIQAL
jgi:hypothetical protein